VIDPLIKIRKTEDQPAENWYEDPWDNPDALHRSDQLEVDALPHDLRSLAGGTYTKSIHLAKVTHNRSLFSKATPLHRLVNDLLTMGLFPVRVCSRGMCRAKEGLS